MIDQGIVIAVAKNGIGLHGTKALLHNGTHIACLGIMVNHRLKLSEEHAIQLQPFFNLVEPSHQRNESWLIGM